MSDLKPKPVTIELAGKEYGILFDLNAIDEIQDRFDIPISQLDELLKDERKVFKILKTLLSIMINEAIDESESGESHVDERFVGRKITAAEIPLLREKILAAFTKGVPECEEGEDPTTSG